MPKVDPNLLGTAAPKVTPEDLDGDVALVKIVGFEQGEIDDTEAATGKRNTAFVWFEEFGEKRIYLGKRTMEAMVAKLGDDSDNWIGATIPIEQVKKMFGTKEFHKVQVMENPDEWDEYDWKKPRAKRTATTATKKATKKAKRAKGK